MPVFEPAAGGSERVRIRHVGPRQAVFPTSPAANVSLLARTDMVARPLPSAEVPASPDWAVGTQTLRLGDSGEMTLTVPNTVSSDGVPWNQRFDPSGHLQFLEVYVDNELEQVCVIDQLPQTDPQQVAVHGSDAMWLLKKAYERDWTVVQGPRDVIERGTQLWVPTTVDGFPAGALSSQWTTALGGPNTITVGPSGGLTFNVTGGDASITASTPVPSSTQAWRASFAFGSVQWSLVGSPSVFVTITESSGDQYQINLIGPAPTAPNAFFSTPGGGYYITVPPSVSYTLLIESDGEWVSAYINGQFVAQVRRSHTATSSLGVKVDVDTSSLPAVVATLSGVLVEYLAPFLQRGSDKGDWVLPGTASTYPSGGLHARYFNDLDLQSDTNRLAGILAPSRTQAYGASAPAEYANQQDAQINSQANPSGAASSNWSAIWFGAIYLKFSGGTYTFSLSLAGTAQAVRIWIGTTQFGAQRLDVWGFGNAGSPYTFTITPAALSGSLPYGAGTVARDGWYPIKVECAVDSTALAAPQLWFTPPASYTDPGGTALTGGTSVKIPATSLSPLGCVDQRYQGISHFDLVQQTAQAYGYQASVEPQPLESGLFPGVLAPRVREGHDTDLKLEPDRGARQDGEGLTNYAASLDASDFATSLQGNGAGLQNGSTGQLQALVYDPATLGASLFDAQGWQDFSDASFPALLNALLNSQLGLKLSAWQALTADPTGRSRWANTWPLPGTLAKMRWRPGDGLRIIAPEINVVDSTPRQMLVVTRNFTPLGITGTQATFANRPRTPAKALKQQLYQATRPQRNYQRQVVTLTGTYQSAISIPAGGTVTNASILSLLASDRLQGAAVRILQNSAGQPLHVIVNGVDQSSLVGGALNGAPLTIAIGAVASPTANGTLFVSFKNVGGSATTVDWQLIATVLR